MPKLTIKESQAARAKLKVYRQAVNKNGAASATKIYNRQVASGKGIANKASAKALGTTTSGPSRPRNASDVLGRKVAPGGPGRPSRTPVAKPTPKPKKTTATKQAAVNKARPKPAASASPKNPSSKPKPRSKPSNKPVETPKGPSSFKEAFAAARKTGVGTTFTFNGKKYAAVTKDDLKKSGHSSLRSFLNAKKKK